MKTYFTFFLIISFLFSGYGQSKLEKSKNQVAKEKTTTPKNPNTSDQSGSSDGIQFIANIIIYTAGPTLFGLYAKEDHLHNRLTAYPYADGESGNYKKMDNYSEIKKTRIDLSNAFLMGTNLYANHFKVKYRPTYVLYFQADYFELFEPKFNEKGFHNLSLFNFNLCYDRIRTKEFTLGWTIGASYIANSVKKFGFNYGLQLEGFFKRNISLFSSIKGSRINGSPVTQFEAALRYHYKKASVSFGYERIKLASSVFNFPALGLGLYI